jgi:hypothetical protein
MSQPPPTERAGKPDTAVEDYATRGRRDWVKLDTATQLDVGFIIFATFAYPILFAVAYLGDLSPVLGVALNSALLLVAATLPLAMLDLPEVENKEGPSMDFAILSVVLIIFIVSFGQLCRHLQSLVGGFAASRSSYWYWARFGFAEFTNAVLFDAPSIYGLKVSDIRSVSLLARSLQFVFHLCLLTVVVVAVARNTGRVRKYWRAQSLASDPGKRKVGMFLLKTTTDDIDRLLVAHGWNCWHRLRSRIGAQPVLLGCCSTLIGTYGGHHTRHRKCCYLARQAFL